MTAKDLLPKRGQKKAAATQEAAKKSAPKKAAAPKSAPKKKDQEPTLPPDPHADQMESATGMSGSTNPRQGQPY